MKLPEDFVRRISSDFEKENKGKTELKELFEAFDRPPSRALRLNSLKGITRESFLKTPGGIAENLLNRQMAELKSDIKQSGKNQEFHESTPHCFSAVTWTEDGVYFMPHLRPGKSSYYRGGIFYIQEASAMLPAAALSPSPGMKVLDLCAAPGGKSSQLAMSMKGKGLLWSNDISVSRARILVRNLELQGVENAVVTAANPEALKNSLPEYFDMVLVDAPCSGEGMFRRDPGAVRAWKNMDFTSLYSLQGEIMENAAGLLKNGGLLLYSTCTFNPCENEERISSFLSSHPEFEEVDLLSLMRKRGLSAGLSPAFQNFGAGCGGVRIWPHLSRGDGHAAFLLRKNSGGAECKKSCEGRSKTGGRIKTFASAKIASSDYRKSEAVKKMLASFLSKEKYKELTDFEAERWRFENGRVHILPEFFPEAKFKNVKFLKTGLMIAELKELRSGFKALPAHGFSLCLKKEDFLSSENFWQDAPELRSYFAGETPSLPLNLLSAAPYIGICVDSFPVGFVKNEGNFVKNIYPPGWRSDRL